MKKIFTSFAMLSMFIMSISAYAQDYITLKSGEEIKSKVTEITSNEIKYKKFDNLDGPIISIDKSTVFMIKYKNGTKDIINPIKDNTQTDNQIKDSKDNKAVDSKDNNSKGTDNNVKNNTDKKPNKKHALLACGLSVLYPGIGQFYNKEPGKGAILMTCYTLELVLFAITPRDYTIVEYSDGTIGGYSSLTTDAYIYLGTAGLTLILSAIDAPLTSRRLNKKNGYTSNIFENNKIGVNIEPHTDFALINEKQCPTLGAKLTFKIK